MTDLKLIRVINKLKEIFYNIIDDNEFKKKSNYEDIWNSRAYTAYIVHMLGESTLELAVKNITDGYKDNGIDAIYYNEEEKKLFIIQTKLSKNRSIELGDLEKFIKGASRIINLNFLNFNQKINNRKSEIENYLLNFDCKIELVIGLGNDQKISDEAKNSLEEFIKTINDNDGIINYQIINITDIYNYMANSQNSKKIIIDNFCLENYGTLKKNDENIVYYGTISAKTLGELREKFGNQLLERNIRYFKNNTDVNNGIMKVLKEEPENFYLYNNGIKIIADKIEKAIISSTERNIAILKLEGASIINGAQTTGCIHSIFKDSEYTLENVRVHIQIISLASLEKDIGKKITKLSNTQNRIETKDFAVQDPIQEHLKRDLAIDGYTYIYKQGNSEENLDQNKSCTIDEATIASGCFCDDINISTTIKGAYGSIFNDLDKAPYKTIFNPKTSPYILWNTVVIYREIQNIEKKFQKDISDNRKLISVHANRMILHLLFYKLKKSKIDIEKSYISIPMPNFDLEKIYKDTLESIYTAKNTLFVEAYPAYIFKNITKCKEIKDYILKSN